MVDHVISVVSSLGLKTYEAGPGYSDFSQIPNTEGSNPLRAIATAWSAMCESEVRAPRSLVVISGDLANIDADTLRFMIGFPGEFSVAPNDGSLQPLCARWASDALWRAVAIARNPKVSAVRVALGANLVTWRDSRWREPGVISPFFDVDTIEDLELLSQVEEDR